MLTSGTPGLLFEPDNESSLVDALDAALDLGAVGRVTERRLASARVWDWSEVLPLYEAVYERMVRGSRARRTRSRASVRMKVASNRSGGAPV